MNILGLDQGSTKTLAILMDGKGSILGKGLGPGACHFFDGMPKAMSAVESAAREALSQAGLAARDLDFVSGGMAGANFPHEITALEDALRELFHVHGVKVYNDCLPALRAGSDSPTCGVICAGTGLNAAWIGLQGVLTIYNNYVEDMDQGGGALGRRVLNAVYMAEIGYLPPTLLTEKVLQLFALETVDSLLLAHQRGWLVKPLKDICPLLFEAARQGDALAKQIIVDFGVSVSRYMLAGIRKYKLQDAELDVVLSGGVFKARSGLLLETIRTEVQRFAPKARIVEALFEPVVGAALFVLDEQLGKPLPETVMANCRASAEKLGLIRL
jgi:N-acetylglucosamine kinase-like BadF-type ATPase